MEVSPLVGLSLFSYVCFPLIGRKSIYLELLEGENKIIRPTPFVIPSPLALVGIIGIIYYFC